MSEFHFGVGRGRVSAAVAKRVNKIAEKHGAAFVSVTLPGDGPRYWFAGRNRGYPFDEQLASAVLKDVDKAGITLP